MFAAAARRMGYHTAVWDPDPDAPAHRLARHSFPMQFSDQQVLDEFAALVGVVTYEWENVPASLCRQLEQCKPLRPSSAILSVIQDRLAQKTFLAGEGCAVPRFTGLTSPTHLSQAVEEVGCPAICKTATAGYDGKGQWKILRESDVPEVQRTLIGTMREGSKWIVEAMVPFERELSILVARDIDGRSVVYPPAENAHEEGILRTTIVPADIPPIVAQRAGGLARNVIERMEGIGVFCLELFQLPGDELLVNEIAPRPHNSGHYTLDACTVSQFEQQVRAVCGLPLGEVRLLSPAVMVNLIGQDIEAVTSGDGCKRLLSVPGAVLHLYGKQNVRPRRKMGHVTFLADQLVTAREQARQFCDSLIKPASR